MKKTKESMFKIIETVKHGTTKQDMCFIHKENIIRVFCNDLIQNNINISESNIF